MLDLSVRRRQGTFQLDVTLAAGPGITALFGPSGSGKTSLINMVAGLSQPDHGRIVVDGRVLFDAEARIDVAPERRRLGYVFQEGRLFPHLSVKANLAFGWQRVPAEERSVRFDEVVEVLGIGHLLDRHPSGLSGGEKSRVAIGRALLASPRILLMDEPLASLDASRKAELLPFIGNLARQFAIPILYVSHAMDEVLGLADTLALMDAGRVVADGPVEDLFARPDLRGFSGYRDAGAVVRATISHHDDRFGITALSFSGGTLLVARVNLPAGSMVRLRIAARDVSLAIEPPRQVSIRNILPARVVSLALSSNHLIDVMLDCGGTTIWSQITSLAQSTLGLTPGLQVFALFKALTVAREDIADYRQRGVVTGINEEKRDSP